MAGVINTPMNQAVIKPLDLNDTRQGAEVKNTHSRQLAM